MGADAVHLVINAVAALVEIPFHLESGEFVGYHADAPAFFVGPGVAIAVGDDLMGVLSSWPSQKGQKPPSPDWGSGLGATGRLARSVAIITQRPTIGSFRNSGIGKLRRSLAKKSCSSCIYTFHIICSKFGEGQARLIVPSRGARSRLWRPSSSST